MRVLQGLTDEEQHGLGQVGRFVVRAAGRRHLGGGRALDDRRAQPYSLSWDEQAILFEELPDHLLAMALYKVNTGWREQEVCKLRWKWEIKVPDLETSVFLIPADFGGHFDDSGVKIGEECLVVLNDVARSILRKQRGLHPEWVFPTRSARYTG